MGSTPPLTKADLRAAALARRDALPPETRAQAATAMAALVAGLPLPQGPLAFYWPIRSEADPRPAVSRLAHPLCLPAVTADGLVFRLWTEGDALTIGPFGLSEPSPNAELVRPTTLIIPLAAFGRGGHRIGYGEGF